MSRHLDNLERLFHKLHRRYGPDDPLCQQAQAEFEDSKAAEPSAVAPHDWSIPYRRLIQDQHSEFMRHTRA
jgi:hypothetical protein